MFNYGSVCSGIESASVAWEPLGLKPAWFSEIEKFPSAVLNHHWPHVANMGDMRQLPGMIRAGLIPAPEILVGGTPCQAFSVAGLREGMDDARGQLTLTYVDILNAIDQQRPNDEAVCLWENVPGVLSDKNNAFGCFLGALAGEDRELKPSGKKWTNAGCVFGPQRAVVWRVLDAQYFGVAQRRRRVFVVASARAGFDPTKVLFESESVRRDTPPSRQAGEKPASTITAGVRNASQNGGENLVARPIHDVATRCGGNDGRGRGSGFGVGHGVFPTVGALDTQCGLDKYAHQSIAAGHLLLEKDIIGTLTARGLNALGARDVEEGILQTHEVRGARKLMPVECERLQGFLDGHTLVPFRNRSSEGCPDGPRYKAIGNSKAVPVVQWVGVRLVAELLR